MPLIKQTVSDIKAELKPAKLIAMFVIVLIILWAFVWLSKKFSWFQPVNPLNKS